MKLSIIIPAYNTGELLKKAVGSVIGQPFQDWELIIVDDGSKDNTPSVCKQLSEKDKRIQIIRTENQGAYKARLTGAENARGEWVMFMDSDDSITPECITGLMKHENSGADIIAGTLNLNNKAVFKHKVSGFLTSSEYICALIDYRTSIGPYAKLFKRELFKNVVQPAMRLNINEDLLMLVSLASNAGKIYIDRELVCYNYLFRESSASKGTMSFRQWDYLFNAILDIGGNRADHKVAEALLHMKIDRIYRAMILKGQRVDPSVPFVREVMDTYTGCPLSEAEIKRVAIIRSPVKQKIAYSKVRVKRIVKRLLKR